MKYTLLQMVQRILSAMDSDEVNSINDTVEATQVAYVIEGVYNNIIAHADLPEMLTLFELDPSGDITIPTLMKLPSNITEMIWMKYDCTTPDDPNRGFSGMTYMPLEQFLGVTLGYANNSGHPTQTYTVSGIDLVCRTDKMPDYYTTYNDRSILFDSYDSTVEDTLQKSKTLCYGEKDATFTLQDSFTPDLDAKQFNLLYNESKALCFAELKQTQHASAEKLARKGWISLQRTKNTIRTGSALDNIKGYGRK